MSLRKCTLALQYGDCKPDEPVYRREAPVPSRNTEVSRTDVETPLFPAKNVRITENCDNKNNIQGGREKVSHYQESSQNRI